MFTPEVLGVYIEVQHERLVKIPLISHAALSRPANEEGVGGRLGLGREQVEPRLSWCPECGFERKEKPRCRGDIRPDPKIRRNTLREGKKFEGIFCGTVTHR